MLPGNSQSKWDRAASRRKPGVNAFHNSKIFSQLVPYLMVKLLWNPTGTNLLLDSSHSKAKQGKKKLICSMF